MEKPEQTDSGFNFDLICENIVDCLPIGVVAFDLDLKIVRANTKSVEYLGINNNSNEKLDRVLSAGTDPAIWQNWETVLKTSIFTRKPQKIEKVGFESESGKKLMVIYCQHLSDSEDNVIGGTIAIEDITEKVNIERKMESIERFAAVGKLAGKVAHELNNPMDGILRYINMTTRILEKENLDKPVEYLSKCREGLMRMVQIISELLEFSRSTYNAFEDMYLKDIIDDAIKSMEHKITACNIEIVKKHSGDLPKVSGGNLFQVFCNLIKNSIDAMGSDGRLEIDTYRKSGNAVIEFGDTGPGITSEHLESVFEPFFTTKKQGKGTGLGLAICKDIVEKYNGSITVKNKDSGGCMFTIILPLENE